METAVVQTYMLDKVIWFSSYQLHVEKSKLGVDVVKLIDDARNRFIFLFPESIMPPGQSSRRTDIQDDLTDYEFIRQILIIEV